MKRKIFLTLCFIMIVASTVYGGDIERANFNHRVPLPIG